VPLAVGWPHLCMALKSIGVPTECNGVPEEFRIFWDFVAFPFVARRRPGAVLKCNGVPEEFRIFWDFVAFGGEDQIGRIHRTNAVFPHTHSIVHGLVIYLPVASLGRHEGWLCPPTKQWLLHTPSAPIGHLGP
jgi:hypothetical protein